MKGIFATQFLSKPDGGMADSMVQQHEVTLQVEIRLQEVFTVKGEKSPRSAVSTGQKTL